MQRCTLALPLLFSLSFSSPFPDTPVSLLFSQPAPEQVNSSLKLSYTDEDEQQKKFEQQQQQQSKSDQQDATPTPMPSDEQQVTVETSEDVSGQPKAPAIVPGSATPTPAPKSATGSTEWLPPGVTPLPDGMSPPADWPPLPANVTPPAGWSAEKAREIATEKAKQITEKPNVDGPPPHGWGGSKAESATASGPGSAPNSAEGNSFKIVSAALTEPLMAGATRVPIDGKAAGFKLGLTVTFNKGAPNQEVALVIDFGSLMLQSPLKYRHEPGEPLEQKVPVYKLPNGASTQPLPSPAPSPKPPETDMPAGPRQDILKTNKPTPVPQPVSKDVENWLPPGVTPLPEGVVPPPGWPPMPPGVSPPPGWPGPKVKQPVAEWLPPGVTPLPEGVPPPPGWPPIPPGVTPPEGWTPGMARMRRKADRAASALKLTLTIAGGLEDFNRLQDRFLIGLATALGISQPRMKLLSVVGGSVIVTVQIVPQDGEITCMELAKMVHVMDLQQLNAALPVPLEKPIEVAAIDFADAPTSGKQLWQPSTDAERRAFEEALRAAVRPLLDVAEARKWMDRSFYLEKLLNQTTLQIDALKALYPDLWARFEEWMTNQTKPYEPQQPTPPSDVGNLTRSARAKWYTQECPTGMEFDYILNDCQCTKGYYYDEEKNECTVLPYNSRLAAVLMNGVNEGLGTRMTKLIVLAADFVDPISDTEGKRRSWPPNRKHLRDL